MPITSAPATWMWMVLFLLKFRTWCDTICASYFIIVLTKHLASDQISRYILGDLRSDRSFRVQECARDLVGLDAVSVLSTGLCSVIVYRITSCSDTIRHAAGKFSLGRYSSGMNGLSETPKMSQRRISDHPDHLHSRYIPHRSGLPPCLPTVHQLFSLLLQPTAPSNRPVFI